ncbi:MAG: hypothetical protein ACM30G_02705 [Micromonosporaceae bacterium]
MFGRKDSRTHTDQLLQELAESYGHLKLAAGHAAGGAAEKLTPPYDKARNTATRGWVSTRNAFAPVYVQMREGAATARRGVELSEKKNRWPVLVSLLAAGAAVGAAGAMIARRRRAAQRWGEFEPDELLEEPGYGRHELPDAASAAVDLAEKASIKASSATKKMTAGAAAVASTVSTQAGKLADRLSDAAGPDDLPAGPDDLPGGPDDASAGLKEQPAGPASQVVPPQTPEDVE